MPNLHLDARGPLVLVCVRLICSRRHAVSLASLMKLYPTGHRLTAPEFLAAGLVRRVQHLSCLPWPRRLARRTR